MENEEEWDDDLSEMNRISKNIDDLTEHIDHLLSWEEFMSHCMVELSSLVRRLSSIEFMAASCVGSNEDVDYGFGLGTCWIGAVAAYEGLLHKLLLNALSVTSLQSRITEFCKSRIDKNSPPKRGMKDASPQSVREWLTTRTITDPRIMAKSFEDIFGIKTEPPDSAFCDHLLKVRNSFTHRGGESHRLSIPDVMLMTRYLNDLATSFTESLVSQGDKVLQEKL